MPTDPELPMSLKDFLLGFLGLGGAGAGGVALRTIGRYEQRVDNLESGVRGLKEVDLRHDAQIRLLETTISGLDERSRTAEISRNRIEDKLDRLQESVDRNGQLYVLRRRQHIIDTGGEVDE